MWHKYSCLIIVLLFTGCTSVLSPGAPRLHVSGHVLDADHKPLAYATVVVNGVRKETDENGCFYFGGNQAASEVDLTANKLGYKQYHGQKGRDFYEVIINLPAENSNDDASAYWQQLTIEELPKYKQCGE